jgi:hypothetical protein
LAVGDIWVGNIEVGAMVTVTELVDAIGVRTRLPGRSVMQCWGSWDGWALCGKEP